MRTALGGKDIHSILAAGVLLAIVGQAHATTQDPQRLGYSSLEIHRHNYPRPVDPARSHTFSIIGMPDTQNYSQFFPQIYAAQTQWIADNASRLNARFVSHYGDVVNNGDRSNEWANARAAMDTLDRAGIPYHVTAGNHDITPSGSPGTPYIPQQYLANFGPQRYADKSWYRGASPTGMSNYQVVTAAGREMLMMSIVCDTPRDELVWAQGVLAANPDKPVMLTTHKYLQDAEDYTAGVPIVPSGRYPSIWYGVEGLYHPQGMQSEEFFDSFVKTNKNIFMVNCGHFHEEYRQTSTNLAGLPVHEVLADYQDDPNGGDGWLRIMNFDTYRNRIDVESYSPTLNQSRTAPESKFSLDVDLRQYRASNPTVSFQNGINNYQGTRDTWINENAANSSAGQSDRFDVDDDTTNSIFSDRRGQALLKFENITTATNESGKIPLGATITEAKLRIRLDDDIDTPLYNPKFRLYLMTRDWNESSTWNSLSGGLTSGSDFGTLIGEFIGDNNPDGEWWRVIDVTSAVQAWANGVPNYGFAILPEIISGNDDGITVWSANAGNILYRPNLTVSYMLGGSPIHAIPAPGTAVAIGLGLAAVRRCRR